MVRRAWPTGSHRAIALALFLLGAASRFTIAADVPQHWSFRPVHRSQPPVPRSHDPLRSPIDAWIARGLEARSLAFQPDAEKRVLARRATFDLIGMPPRSAEIDQFVSDDRPGAYERLIDRLLASPHYGETWGRQWLDLVRYAETAGYNADPTRPLAYKYRDYVVKAFNQDRPYDRFIQEQIAGDELFPTSVDAQIATGYLRMWPDESNASIVALARQDALNDLTANVGAVYLGLSIGCAQCHDHKFDPIKQHDFYRLQAFFAGIVPVERVAVGTPGELAAYRRRFDDWLEKTEAKRGELHRITSTARAKAGAERRRRFPPDVLTAIDKPLEKRTALERQLVFWSDRQIVVSEKELLSQMTPADREALPKLRKEVERLEKRRPAPPRRVEALAAVEIPGAFPATYLLGGGSYKDHIREVQPGFLSVLDQNRERPAEFHADRPGTSGRRTAVARWLTDPRNPLVARVIVNRVWQGHLGRGIAENANDFGTQSQPPTHPELLDWLAADFVEHGWSIKRLHRQIMTSAVYRQAAIRETRSEPTSIVKIDPENALFGRFARRRLSAEAIRDSYLAISGRLDEKLAGPSVTPPLPPSYPKYESWPALKNPHVGDRRSIYVFAKRNLPFPLLNAFDLPDMHESCPRRPTTIIAPQALALMNSEFAVKCGEDWAADLIRRLPNANWKARVQAAYRDAFGREPAATEVNEALAFLQAQAERVTPPQQLIADEGHGHAEESAYAAAFDDLCHVLLNANEFLYVE